MTLEFKDTEYEAIHREHPIGYIVGVVDTVIVNMDLIFTYCIFNCNKNSDTPVTRTISFSKTVSGSYTFS